MHFNLASLGLIAAFIMSSVSAASHMEGAATNNALATENANLMAISKRNFLSRRKVANILERRKIVCNHKNHKTYQRGDDLKHHFRPHRHHRCGGNGSQHCDHDGDDFEFEYNNDYAEDEYDDYDDDDYFECDECDACDDDDDYYMDWSDYEDETT